MDASKAGVPVFAAHGRTQVRSLQGEIFFQLGGTDALKLLAAAERAGDDLRPAATFGPKPEGAG